MELSILIVVVIVLITVVLGTKQYKQTKEALNDGSIIKRDADFIETTEKFTLQKVDFPAVICALKETDFSKAGVSVKGSTQEGAVNFSGSNWAARLVPLQSEADTYSYSFSFTKWQTYRGMPQNITAMNVTLTALEKMFLKLDPNTKVESWKNKTKTKPSFLS